MGDILFSQKGKIFSRLYGGSYEKKSLCVFLSGSKVTGQFNGFDIAVGSNEVFSSWEFSE